MENRFSQVQKDQADAAASLKELERKLSKVEGRQAECCTKIAVLESVNGHMESKLMDMKKVIDDRDADEKTNIGFWIAIASTIVGIIGLMVGFFIPR
jgi:chromosome segregation ATPase